MGVLWFLLNMFSEENWDDEKLKVFGIVLAISIFGGVAAHYAADYVDPFSALGVYMLVGTVCLWALASLKFKMAAAAMAIFTGYKIVVALVFLYVF